MHNKGFLKRLTAIGLLLICCNIPSYGEVKIINIPDNVKIEESVFKETVINNLTDECEIYTHNRLYLVDRHFDSVKSQVVIPEEEGIWCSFMNRYELRYYKKEKLAVEIRAPKNFLLPFGRLEYFRGFGSVD